MENGKRKVEAALLASLLGIGVGGGLTGCESQGPFEEAGEEVDEAVEETDEAVDEAEDEL